MDPINPWIDPSETRRMAESLRGPARQPITAPDDAGFDDSFVGFSEVPVASADDPQAPALPTIESQDAPAQPAETAPAPVDACPRFGWLRECFGALGHFIYRDDGVLVCNDGEYGAYHFIARDLSCAEGGSQRVRLRILANAVLEIIAVETNGTRLWLGVVVPTPLEPESVRKIRQQWLADGTGE